MAHEVLLAIGCVPPSAEIIAEHLVAADLRGVSSHGTMRLTQYAKQAQTGYLNPAGTPTATQTARGSTVVDGGGGYGHPAMMMGVREAIERARGSNSSVVAVRNCGHTGRLGHYAEVAAGSDIATIIAGGGAARSLAAGRPAWRNRPEACDESLGLRLPRYRRRADRRRLRHRRSCRRKSDGCEEAR